ncbi:MAG: DUF47 family protein [Magnetococcales bacterium]|nr:DUF47 family protein [Magnetococcales bacterium]NGZ05284.1 DUF47 family protein [Magnetococcales bacterium]
MSGSSNSFASRILNNVFPRVPDFYGMINDQCDICAQTMDALAEFMESGSTDKGLLVRELEKKGDEIKIRNMNVLNQAFATPMDREDIYRAITAIDQIINYAKTTIREMEGLGLQPDEHTREMVQMMREGVDALKRGFQKLGVTPALADQDADAVRKAERNTEKAYRRAISDLFMVDAQMRALDNDEPHAKSAALVHIMEIFKRRELYRHLSNTADKMAEAADVLHDIVVQIS